MKSLSALSLSLLLGATPLLSACGGPQEEAPATPPPAPTTQTSTGSPTPTSAVGTSSCAPYTFQDIVGRGNPPLLFTGGKAEVKAEETTVTLDLTSPVTKDSFTQGRGDAALKQYGFRIYAADGSFLDYSFMDDSPQAFTKDGERLPEQFPVIFQRERSTASFTFPTKALNFDARDWAATVYAAFPDSTRLTGCSMGSKAIAAAQDAIVFTTAEQTATETPEP